MGKECCLGWAPALRLRGGSPGGRANMPSRRVARRWPFVAGFSTTAYIFIKVAASVTDEDVKNSTFTNPKH